MRINDDIRELIGKGAPTARIRLVAKQSGMIPLKDYSIRLVGQGMTTAEEVVRVTLTDTTGDDKLCSKCRNPISDDFVKCPFCQHDLKISCKRCGTLQNETWTSCPKCGHNHSQDAKEQVCNCCGAEIVGDWTECPYCLTFKLDDCSKEMPATTENDTADKAPEANESKAKKRKRRK